MRFNQKLFLSSIFIIFLSPYGASALTTTTVTDAGINTTGNITADWLSQKFDWFGLQNVPNIIYTIWSEYNDNNLLISNGTAIGYNSTKFNNSIENYGRSKGWANETWVTNNFWRLVGDNIHTQDEAMDNYGFRNVNNSNFSGITIGDGIEGNDYRLYGIANRDEKPIKYYVGGTHETPEADLGYAHLYGEDTLNLTYPAQDVVGYGDVRNVVGENIGWRLLPFFNDGQIFANFSMMYFLYASADIYSSIPINSVVFQDTFYYVYQPEYVGIDLQPTFQNGTGNATGLHIGNICYKNQENCLAIKTENGSVIFKGDSSNVTIDQGSIEATGNVNINNGANVTANYGFFSYLGSLTSRVNDIFSERINTNNLTINDKVTAPYGSFRDIGDTWEYAGNNLTGVLSNCIVIANGTNYSRADYPVAYSRLDLAWGNNSANDFKVPNYQGRVIVGVGTGTDGITYSLGNTGGSANVTLTIDQLPPIDMDSYKTDTPHNHGLLGGSYVTDTSTADAERYSANKVTVYQGKVATTGNANSGVSFSSFGGNQSHENRMPYSTAYKLIKIC